MTNAVVHTDKEGTVWTLRPNGIPVAVLPDRLLDCYPANDYYILGQPENFKLIADLYTQITSKSTKSRIIVGKPWTEETDVQVVLSQMSVLPISNMQFGIWNPVTITDHTHYKFLYKCDEQLFKHHCLYRVFKYLHINMWDAHELMRAIGDPRWLMSPRSDFKFIKATKFFGLTADVSREYGRLNMRQYYRHRMLLRILSNSLDGYVSESRKPIFVDIPEANIPSGVPEPLWDSVRRARRLLNFILTHWYQFLTGVVCVDLDLYFEDSNRLRERYLSEVILEIGSE